MHIVVQYDTNTRFRPDATCFLSPERLICRYAPRPQIISARKTSLCPLAAQSHSLALLYSNDPDSAALATAFEFALGFAIAAARVVRPNVPPVLTSLLAPPAAFAATEPVLR